MTETNAPIGIIDSGVGGLTTAAQLSLLLPGENIIYCGDNANAPYGNRSGEEIVELTTRMLDFLEARGVKMVAVACNTISATFDSPELGGYEKNYDFPVLSIIRAAAADVAHLKYEKVGVIATAFTVASGCYDRLIDRLDPAIEVYGEPSKNLAALIEKGDLADPAIDHEVGMHVDTLMGAHPGVRDIVLGCTHYPIVIDVFRKKAPHVAFINPARDQARQVRLELSKSGLLHHGKHDAVGSMDIYTSGTRSVFETILSELQISRDYSFEVVDFHPTDRR